MNPHRRLLTAALALAAVLAPAFRVTAQGPGAAANNPDLIEARKYTLTMDKVQKLADTTTAVNKLLASDSALKAKVDAGSSNNLPMDQQAKFMDATFPQIAAVIHAHGFTTREYILASIAFINDVTFVGMKKQGMIRDYPPNSITPENAAFVEANFDKLQQIGQALAPPQQR
jgi:hypothetical protein